jgi:hypothetical protein
MLKTSYEGWEFTHRVLWQIVRDQAAIARDRDRDWRNPSLVAMVFAFHAVEAYVNFAGEQLAPEIWKDERNFFRNEPYRGWEGKVRKVLELADLPWSSSVPPLKTVLDLKALRDVIAHGKSERFEGTILHPDMDDIPYPVSKLWSMVTPKEKLPILLGDVETFIAQIHERLAPRVGDHFFKASALGGPTWYVSRNTSAT